MGSWRCETAALTSLRPAALHVKSHQERPVVPISQRRRLSLRSQDGKELGVEMGGSQNRTDGSRADVFSIRLNTSFGYRLYAGFR